ncbi:DNA recombination protein RecN [Helicobacter jaachi]|uniref:DNA repair protein RecN n=1 Tax=Helicobacter jaachi TaxID=1677920 RepID=A0A4U8T9J0_9HELI|nr:DNA recombination protein RecN [Helicobacter jaachi]TLD96304.1 DNA recombination protein RecN [Helicobacter jaachi]
MVGRILIHKSPAFNDIELYMQGGFNVFSGASGSGKSVFMDSLLAILGIKESNADLIEANIAIENLNCDLASYGIDDKEDNEIVLSILKKDKTRYFINHSSSSKKKLYEIVSGFAKHISTKGADELKGANILRILDIFISQQDSAHRQILSEYEADFKTLIHIRDELKDIAQKEANIAHLKEFAAFEIAKIESINPKEGQYEELLALKKMLSKQEKIKEHIYKVRQALELRGELEEFLNLIDEPCPSLVEGLNEFEAILERQEERLGDLEELNTEEILDKLAALSELNRRFGGVKEALAYLEEQKAKLVAYDNLAFDKQSLQKKEAALTQKCEANAKKLHENRIHFAPLLNERINALCEQLKLKPSHIVLKSVPMGHSGISQCEIMLGESDVGVLSSGEYNRLRLALMCVDTQLEPRSGILVLDEIDANLSGEESEGVAQILKMLSHDYQIFAISHQTHMPSLADNHYLVSKNGTTSVITKLDYEGRVKEIARIISGANITPEALEFARTHLDKAKG